MSHPLQDGTFVGAVHADRRVAGLRLAETSYHPGMVVAAHVHESLLITHVLAGALTEERGHRRALCETGSLIVHPAAEPHAHRFSESGGRCFILQLDPPWLERMRGFGLTDPGAPADLRRTRANWLAAQLYREFRTPDDAADLAIEGFALAMLGEIARARARREAGARPPWLVRAIDILQAQLTAPPRLAALAEAVGVHPAHLSRTFHQHLGCTMSEYIRRQRVERAQRELVETDRPLAEIAYRTGFSDQAHFSRVFRQLTGTTPAAYRRASLRR